VPAARFSLVTEKRALTKFLKCVDWSDAQEAQQVGEAALPSQHGCTQHHKYMCVHRLAALPSQRGSMVDDRCSLTIAKYEPHHPALVQLFQHIFPSWDVAGDCIVICSASGIMLLLLLLLLLPGV
jgi:hypothetical protein